MEYLAGLIGLTVFTSTVYTVVWTMLVVFFELFGIDNIVIFEIGE